MLTVTDLFCGAGGSSSGAIRVPGITIRMAANHWKLAVETHNSNHPTADHDCADISQTDPRRYPRTDILWASPECTNHSVAKGRKRGVDSHPDLFGETLPDEAAIRSRSTMWDVLRFAEHHRYAAVVVENVIDVRDWVMWPAWTTGMTNLGYAFQVVYLNSMFAQAAGAPAPQSRDRLYVVAWRFNDRKPDLGRWTRPQAYCPTCQRTTRAIQAWKRMDRQHGRYRAQYVWRCASPRCHEEVYPGVLPAATAIDWQLAAERIGDRARPLAPKTIARIEAGLRRYARQAAAVTDPSSLTVHQDGPAQIRAASSGAVFPPMMLAVGGPNHKSPARTLHDEPMTARLTRDTDAIVVPVEGRDGISARPATDPARTQTARLQDALVVPLRGANSCKPAETDPLDTVAANGNHHALLMRNNTARGDQGQMSTPVDEPARTITTAGHQSLIRWDHLLVPYYGTGVARQVAEPMGAVTTTDRNALVGAEVAVDDCTFRMLEPHEIQAAMAFEAGYVVLGNKRERVRQLGNAVTPPAARDLIAAVVEAITGEPVAATGGSQP